MKKRQEREMQKPTRIEAEGELETFSISRLVLAELGWADSASHRLILPTG